MPSRTVFLVALLTALPIAALTAPAATAAAPAYEGAPCIGFSADGATAWYLDDSCAVDPDGDRALVQVMKVDVGANAAAAVRTIADVARKKKKGADDPCEAAAAALKAAVASIGELVTKEGLVACEAWEQKTAWQLLAAPRGSRDIADAAYLGSQQAWASPGRLQGTAALVAGLEASGRPAAAAWVVAAANRTATEGEDALRAVQNAQLHASVWRRLGQAGKAGPGALERHMAAARAAIEAIPFVKGSGAAPDELDFARLAEAVRLYHAVGLTEEAAALAERAYKLLRRKRGDGTDYAAVAGARALVGDKKGAMEILRVVRGKWSQLEAWSQGARGFAIAGDTKSANKALGKAAKAVGKMKGGASEAAALTMARACMAVGKAAKAKKWLGVARVPEEVGGWWIALETTPIGDVELPAPAELARGVEALGEATTEVVAAALESRIAEALCAQGRTKDAVAMNDSIHGMIEASVLVWASASFLLKGERPSKALANDLANERPL